MTNRSLVEYLWLDGAINTPQIRTVSRVLPIPEQATLKDFPEWNFNGALTGQEGSEADCILRPVRIYRDPLRGESNNYIVLCEVRDSGGNTHSTNIRSLYRAAIKAAGKELAPWLGFEQFYNLYREDPFLGFAEKANSGKGQAHFFNVGCENVFGREVAEAHAQACISAGVNFGGFNVEGAPGQWRFEVGYNGGVDKVCDALTVADDLWIARYLLKRLGENYAVCVSFDAQSEIDLSANSNPFKSTLPSVLTNYSTTYTRDPRCGLTAIQAVVKELRSDKRQVDDFALEHCSNSQDVYKMSSFRSRNKPNSTIEVPMQVIEQGHGFIKESRIGANEDPYRIGIHLISVALADDEHWCNLLEAKRVIIGNHL